ncbi:MAG: discoidin domain-containing protein, partial [Bacteroidaceae bacterium]|nr:discoidin domain-containing protein [Bacteroidaceae bacterium]
TAIDAAQTAIKECASSITEDGDEYTVVWNFETAGDVDKATLIAAYEALAQANEVYNGNASTVSQYQKAKEDLSTPIATLNQYQQGDHKEQLKSKVDLLTALIENCKETHGDLTDIMYEDILQHYTDATTYLTQEFATHDDLVKAIPPAIQYIEDNIGTWSAAQQSPAKTALRAMIAELEKLIGDCRTNGTKIITTDVPCALQTTVGEDFYISTNATATEGDIANLVDGKMNTSFQTKNSVEAEHYLLVDAGDGKALKKFKFSYRTNKSFFPYTIVVYGSNEEDEFTEVLAIFSKDDANNPLPTNADQLWTSSEIVSETAYRYLRFNITKSGIAIKVDDNKDIDTSKGEQLSNKYKNTLYTETPQVEYCFAMSEFDLINRVDVEGVTEDQITPAETAIDDANALAETSADATALSEMKKALQTRFDALKAAYDAASQRIQVTLTTTDAKRDELLSGIEFDQTIGTFSAPYATVIPEGVTAYYAEQDYDRGTVSLTPIKDVAALPANQGVILIGEVGVNSVMLLPATDETQADLSENKFSNSAPGSVEMEDDDYILAMGDQGSGFYHATPGSTLKQGKAFFRILDPSAPLSFVLRFGGNITDIDAITTGTTSDNELIYDIYGRRVTEVKKGNIYIKNGKKFFVK